MKHLISLLVPLMTLSACGGGGDTRAINSDTVAIAALSLPSLPPLQRSASTLPSTTPSATGPALETPVNQLIAALVCSYDLESATRPPVLMVPGIFLNPDNQYSWNWLI